MEVTVTLPTATDKAPQDLAVDTLVLLARPTDDGAALVAGHGLNGKSAKAVDAALAAVGASGKDGERTVLPAPAGVSAGTVVVCGLGDGRLATGAEALRRAAGVGLRGLKGTVAIAFPHADAAELAAIAEGALFGAYSYAGIHAEAPDPGRRTRKAASAKGLTDLTVATGLGKAAKGVLARAEVLADALGWARDLVNTPPNLLTPQSFVEAVQERVAAKGVKVEVTVLNEEQLRDQGFGGITGVGQGSANPPRIVRIAWAPRSQVAPVALVGKGITFDSGGLCIKPAGSMATMKSDMAGAAAVAATTIAAAALDVRTPVTAYLGLAENMPGANAQRPGDVVTMRDGTTVEILDTDAEGRMVLADCISLAIEDGAERVVDVATLTGACVVALGNRVTGVMGNDPVFVDEVLARATEAGEQMWPLPLPADLRSCLDSPFADMAHKGDRWGGALTAGIFLEHFAVRGEERTPVTWAHLDIAGPSYNEGSPWGYTPKGGTGAAVPTLLALLEQFAAR